MRINGTSAFSAIQLADGQKVPNQVQVLRVGAFNHPKYGAFEITTQTLSEMKANFEKNIRGIDMSFDYFHDSDREASAWVKKLILSDDGQELWAEVDWTPKAEQKLSERELRYFSPDFAFKWKDPEKGITFSNVLFGGGLTNRPFVKEMKAIVAHENQGEKMTELEKAQARVKELEAANVKLSEDKAAMEKKMADMPPGGQVGPEGGPKETDAVAALKKQIADLEAALAKAKGDHDVLMAEKTKADQALACAEKEKEFNVLLSEGKACAAQKDAFIKNDMAAFIKLAEPVKMKAQGSGNGAGAEIPDDFNAKAIKLAEEKEKANPKLTRGESMSLAIKELKAAK